MKRIFTLTIFSLFCFAASAQLEVSVESFKMEIADTTKHMFDFSVTNTETAAVEVYWKLIKDADFPVEWKTTVCDGNLCYSPNFDTCPDTKPNVIDGTTTSNGWSVKVDPRGVAGKGLLHLEFYSDPAFQNLIHTTEAEACFLVTGTVSSTEDDVFSSNMILYPNPTIEYFNIKNDKNVSSVSVHNVIGKEVWTKAHTEGTQYDVSDLYKGMYIVRLHNQSGKLIKTMRLNKTSI